MQHLMDAQSEAKRSHWLDHTETLSVMGSIGGAIASVVTQQVAFASIPLSLTAALHLANRRRLTQAACQARQMTISQLMQQDEEYKAQIAKTAEYGQGNTSEIAKLVKQDADKQLSIDALTKQNQAQQQTLDALSNKLNLIEQQGSKLSQQTNELQQDSDLLKEKEEELATALETLQEIDQLTQVIRTTPDDATLYYRRGKVRGTLPRLDDQRIAIDDYSQAISLDANYADAYLQRGILRSLNSEKRQAVSDLRTAAKIYFEQGDLENYDRAMNLSQEQHDLVSAIAIETETEAQESDALVVTALFS